MFDCHVPYEVALELSFIRAEIAGELGLFPTLVRRVTVQGGFVCIRTAALVANVAARSSGRHTSLIA